MILSARWILPISSAAFESGAVLVQGDRIADLGPKERLLKEHPDEPSKHFPNSALLPGLVNVHSHLELTVLRGYLEGLDFWSWIRKLTETKYQVLSREDLLSSALLGAVEAIRSGVTTLADPMDLGTSLEAMLKTGLRGILYQEVFSPKPEEADVVLKSLKVKLEELEAVLTQQPQRGRRLSLGISPHAPYTVSGELFKKVAEFGRAKGLRSCIHLAESEAETLFLRDGSGQIGDSYRERGIGWTPPDCTPVEYLDRLQVLSPLTLLVHCIRLIPSDYAILRDRHVSVAHCPKSNWRLGHSSMNLRQMREHGIPVGLGSDSVVSNNTMDLFEEMRFMLANPSLYAEHSSLGASRTLPSADALRMVTLGGAEVLGLARQIGSLETGKQADIIAVDLSKPHLRPVFSPLDALVHSAKSSDVQFSMVGGEVLFEQDRIFTVSEDILDSQIDQVRQKLQNARNEA
jgi:cytosine/adenosine deaminase-related metal-dependent hydrolase